MNSNDTSENVALTVAEADAAWVCDELKFEWRMAQDDAVEAHAHWRESAASTEHAVYRAAQDRADQAQDVLAAACAPVPGLAWRPPMRCGGQ
jgi:hypothetical protein